MAGHPPPTQHISDWHDFVAAVTSTDTYTSLGVHLLKLVLILLVARVVIALSRRAIERTMLPLIEADERRNQFALAARHRTLVGLLRSISRYTIYFITGISILATWNIATLGLLGTALGTAGILGVVVGFGAQKLVRDVITGLFILSEDQYSVGDTVTIGAVTGVVEEVGVRITRIRDDVGRLNLIPNGDISQVTNHSRGRLETSVDVNVPLEQDLDAFRQVLKTVEKRLTANADGPVQGGVGLEGITAMDGAKITARVSAAAAPGRQKAAELALREALREEMLAAGMKPL